MNGYLPGKTPFCTIIHLAVIAAVVLCMSGMAMAKGIVTPSGATIEYSNSPTELIVGYTLQLGELANSDPGPTLKIYGDGSAHVHYPTYMTRAGNYIVQLTDEELAEIIDILIAGGILEFDHAWVRAKMIEIDALRRSNQGTMQFVSDRSTSILEMHLEAYSSPGIQSVQSRNLDRTVQWSGLHADVRQYPNLDAIQNLSAAEQSLRRIMKRPDLVKAESGNSSGSSVLRKD